MEQRPKKLLEQVQDVIRLKHYSYQTEKTYIYWIRRYILFHNKRHPSYMGSTEIETFLTHLAVHENVAASTPNQALHAVLRKRSPSDFNEGDRIHNHSLECDGVTQERS
ncbi:phage integrase N-terminal SAM-like domain-containing protein [Nostoc sp. CHAB 5715]|uniref:phage integrase N-terminal SAM-like domain-containing protein n=1 Tax=Nostoc sp. CHAB 5715 TaxID=2780400 RepID=UPI001E52CD69|nr:phage integrase N-terminal SAM-like domain-containing protein [Nostoc sp. CHAB 5715]MCC5624500.1 phage integrase N-terminal SAM-like domain-containing protein [Nostoc sp. CHAB 5715]